MRRLDFVKGCVISPQFNPLKERNSVMTSETVYTDERIPWVQIRWTGGCTFNIWAEGNRKGYHCENGWCNVDCFTLYGDDEGHAPTPTQAEVAAEEHFQQILDEELEE